MNPNGMTARLASVADLPSQQQHLSVLAAFKQGAIEHMRAHAIDTLGQQLLRSRDLTGKLFTHYSNFWFSGLSKLHPDRQPSNTAWGELSGQKRKFMFGAIQEHRQDKLIAIPYLVGDILIGSGSQDVQTAGQWLHHRELHIDELDCFNAVRGVHPQRGAKALEPLRYIPEMQIKEAFADIIGEPHVPKDWGGERSDLFTTYVAIDGRRITTAFAFKGPSKFQPMTMAQLGKNGDQIDRLFTEPAELLVLQHCHQITPPVRSAMRAYAQRVGDPRLYCVIDGYDTLRILQIYGKCGLSSVPSATP